MVRHRVRTFIEHVLRSTIKLGVSSLMIHRTWKLTYIPIDRLNLCKWNSPARNEPAPPRPQRRPSSQLDWSPRLNQRIMNTDRINPEALVNRLYSISNNNRLWTTSCHFPERTGISPNQNSSNVSTLRETTRLYGVRRMPRCVVEKTELPIRPCWEFPFLHNSDNDRNQPEHQLRQMLLEHVCRYPGQWKDVFYYCNPIEKTSPLDFSICGAISASYVPSHPSANGWTSE